MKYRDIIGGLFWLGVGVLFFVWSTRYPRGSLRQPGPGFIPAALGILLVLLSLMPFKSGSESQAAILGGHIHFAVGDLPYPLVEAGKIRVLLVFKDKRDPLDPDTPAFSDFGYDTPFPTMLNVVGPKALPEGIVKKIDQAFHNAMKAPAFIKGMQMLHIPPFYRSSRDLNEYVAQNYALFSKIFKEKGLIK